MEVSMNESIKVEVKTVYGNRAIYPACEKANHFAGLAGTRTFTDRAIEHIKALGYRVEVVTTQPKEL
jgi:hypothetical protein